MKNPGEAPLVNQARSPKSQGRSSCPPESRMKIPKVIDCLAELEKLTHAGFLMLKNQALL